MSSHLKDKLFSKSMLHLVLVLLVSISLSGVELSA